MKKIYRLLYSNKFVAMVMLLMQIITFVAMYIWISDYSKVLFAYCDYTYIRCFVLSVYKGTGSVNEYR